MDCRYVPAGAAGAQRVEEDVAQTVVVERVQVVAGRGVASALIADLPRVAEAVDRRADHCLAAIAQHSCELVGERRLPGTIDAVHSDSGDGAVYVPIDEVSDLVNHLAS